jgi:hypothetical protein
VIWSLNSTLPYSIIFIKLPALSFSKLFTTGKTLLFLGIASLHLPHPAL